MKREKCSPLPCQCLIFLGAVLDSTTMTLSLPQPKRTTIVDTCHHLLAQGSGSVRTLSMPQNKARAQPTRGFRPGPLECGRGEVPHQCLRAMYSNIGSESPSAVSRASTSPTETYSFENRQHHSGGVYQQERGHPLPCSDCPSPRVVGSSLDSRSITSTSAYLRHSKCGSRHSFQADRDQNRMDIG